MTILSPHFDDAALSLGQSLTDGALARCDVRTLVVFGRTNWTRWMHPTRSRAAFVSRLRRLEEARAARRFGYSWSAADWEEAILRWGFLADAGELLDSDNDLAGEPLIPEIADWIVQHCSDSAPDLVLAPVGLGGHVDHRIVSLAASRITSSTGTPFGFYEDRPYASYVEPSTVADLVQDLVAGEGRQAVSVALSGTVTERTHRRLRRCYRSQMDEYFTAAMLRDVSNRSVESAWFAPGSVPGWLS